MVALCPGGNRVAAGGLHPAASGAHCDTLATACADNDTCSHACIHISANSHLYAYADIITPNADSNTYTHTSTYANSHTHPDTNTQVNTYFDT